MDSNSNRWKYRMWRYEISDYTLKNSDLCIYNWEGTARKDNGDGEKPRQCILMETKVTNGFDFFSLYNLLCEYWGETNSEEIYWFCNIEVILRVGCVIMIIIITSTFF